MNETKIYLIKFKNFPKIIYVGNTHLDLNKRLLKHRYHFTSVHQYVLKNKIDWNDVYIELYENFKYNERKEYEEREKEVIQSFLNNDEYIVINISKTGGRQTDMIKKEVEKYLIKNIKEIINNNLSNYNNEYKNIKEIINNDLSNYKNELKKIYQNKKAKEHYQKNKEIILEKRKEYVKNNIDKIKEYKKNYYEKNKNQSIS